MEEFDCLNVNTMLDLFMVSADQSRDCGVGGKISWPDSSIHHVGRKQQTSRASEKLKILVKKLHASRLWSLEFRAETVKILTLSAATYLAEEGFLTLTVKKWNEFQLENYRRCSLMCQIGRETLILQNISAILHLMSVYCLCWFPNVSGPSVQGNGETVEAQSDSDVWTGTWGRRELISYKRCCRRRALYTENFVGGR